MFKEFLFTVRGGGGSGNQRCLTVYAFLVKDITGNIHVILF